MSQDEADEARAQLALGQRDVERMTFQIIQSSVSLIGFGFTIHAFLNNADAEAAFTIDLEQAARRLGLAMMTLGLLNLGLGIANQSRYLRDLRRRYPVPPDPAVRNAYSPRPTFLIAWILLGIGMIAFASIIRQMFG